MKNLVKNSSIAALLALSFTPYATISNVETTKFKTFVVGMYAHP